MEENVFFPMELVKIYFKTKKLTDFDKYYYIKI